MGGEGSTAPADTSAGRERERDVESPGFSARRAEAGRETLASQIGEFDFGGKNTNEELRSDGERINRAGAPVGQAHCWCCGSSGLVSGRETPRANSLRIKLSFLLLSLFQTRFFSSFF